MRLSVLIALTVLASPAAAADSIADQAQAAFDLFAAGQSQPDYLIGGYAKTVLEGVGGKWVSLTGPAPGTGIETYGTDTEKGCKTPAVLTLASTDGLTMNLSANPAGTPFTQTYTLIVGSTFAESTKPADYFAAIGLGSDKVGAQFDQRRALALSLANGVVQIYRPSEDILVLSRDKAYPTVLARCPA